MSVVRSCITSWDTCSAPARDGHPVRFRDETTITRCNPLRELVHAARTWRPGAGYRVIADVAVHRSTAVCGRSGESACSMPRTKRSASRSTGRVPCRGPRSQTLDRLPPPVADLDPVRRLRAAHQVFVDSAITHERLPFAIGKTVVETPAGAQVVAVHEEVVARTPFCTLLRFAKDLPDGAPPQPRVLLVAPLSGHFATLLTDTVRTMLPDHDVHITDWHNARDVGLEHGPFGLDELVDHVVEFLQVLGPRSHVMAVCQPCVPVLAAVAVLAEDRNLARPASMTLVAGPVDVDAEPDLGEHAGPLRSARLVPRHRRHPGAPAVRRRGPPRVPGVPAARRVRRDEPEAARRRALGLIEALVAGDVVQARSTRDFYDEYLAVADLPAEVYLDTIEHIFQGNRLARGEYEWRGRRVHPERITRTGPADGRGRARRHLRTRPDHGRARAVHPHPGLPPPPPPAGRGRALRRVQRAPVGGSGLPVVRSFIAANS